MDWMLAVRKEEDARMTGVFLTRTTSEQSQERLKGRSKLGGEEESRT